MTDLADRRGAQRNAAADEPWTISLTRSDDDRSPQAASALDLSGAGVRLRVQVVVVVGECLHLQLDSVRMGASFRLAGRVRWVMGMPEGGYEIGLDFNEFAGQELTRWVQWVASEARDPGHDATDGNG